MKIQKVKIKKFKCLENIESEINGSNIILLADNGRGKSSFMQFIQIALGDTKNIPVNAEGEGEIIVDKDGNKLEFKLSFNKEGKPVISINGMKNVKKSYIASVVGAMSFDINHFVELSKTKAGRKEQVEIFKSFLPKDVQDEIAKYEQSIESNYNERTDVNRNITEIESVINTHYLKNANLDSFKHTELKDIFSEQKKATEHNDKIKDIKDRLKARKEEIEKGEKEIAEMLAKIEVLKKKADENETVNEQAEQWLAAKENQPVDVSVFEQKITTISEDNKKYQDAQTLKGKIELFEKCQKESKELSDKIAMERQAVADTIKEMGGPVDGLTFDEETLLWNGIPVAFESLSTSEIIELGIRLKMAENPDLGILFIEHGESIGAARLREIQEIADKANWQIIMEQVERGQEELKIEIMGEAPELVTK